MAASQHRRVTGSVAAVLQPASRFNPIIFPDWSKTASVGSKPPAGTDTPELLVPPP